MKNHPVAIKRDVSVSRWALERLVVAPGHDLDAVQARIDYLAWASDFPGTRPEPKTKMRAAVLAAGGTVKGYATGAKARTYPLTYCDLTLAGSVEVPVPPRATPDVSLAALTALRDTGLVTDRDALNRAWRELR